MGQPKTKKNDKNCLWVKRFLVQNNEDSDLENGDNRVFFETWV